MVLLMFSLLLTFTSQRSFWWAKSLVYQTATGATTLHPQISGRDKLTRMSSACRTTLWSCTQSTLALMRRELQLTRCTAGIGTRRILLSTSTLCRCHSRSNDPLHVTRLGHGDTVYTYMCQFTCTHERKRQPSTPTTSMSLTHNTHLVTRHGGT